MERKVEFRQNKNEYIHTTNMEGRRESKKKNTQTLQYIKAYIIKASKHENSVTKLFTITINTHFLVAWTANTQSILAYSFHARDVILMAFYLCAEPCNMCNNVYVCVCGVRACAYNNNILPFRIFKVLYAMDGGRRVNEYPIKLRQKKKKNTKLSWKTKLKQWIQKCTYALKCARWIIMVEAKKKREKTNTNTRHT